MDELGEWVKVSQTSELTNAAYLFQSRCRVCRGRLRQNSAGTPVSVNVVFVSMGGASRMYSVTLFSFFHFDLQVLPAIDLNRVYCSVSVKVKTLRCGRGSPDGPPREVPQKTGKAYTDTQINLARNGPSSSCQCQLQSPLSLESPCLPILFHIPSVG